MTVSVSFPVEAHVRKYLMKRYGSAHIAQTAGKQSLLGLLVLGSLTHVYGRQSTTIEDKYRHTVLVPEKYYREYGHSLNRNTEQYLGNCATRMFNEALYEFLDMKVAEGAAALPALKLFMAVHWITEDDIKTETLYKAYQRHCQMQIKPRKPAPERKKTPKRRR